MKTLLSIDGRTILVSDKDYPVLSQFTWRVTEKGHIFRWVHRGKKGKRFRRFMHREILDASPGNVVDHINGDPTDNRRENLREITPAENSRNKAKYAGKSKYKGVSLRGNKFRVSIGYNGHRYHLGTVSDETVAALIYDFHARQLDPDHFRTNLPNSHPRIPEALDYISKHPVTYHDDEPLLRTKARGTYINGTGTDGKRFGARIYKNGKQINLGTFKTLHEARQAYLKAKANIHEL